MTVIVNVTPAWIRGKSTVSPNDGVEFLLPRIFARVRRAAAKCAGFGAESLQPITQKARSGSSDHPPLMQE